MLRSTFALAAAGLVALTAGCRMCANPYDYCGPTFTGEGCQQCMPNARACSILAPQRGPCCGTEAVSEMMAPLPDAEMVGPVPGIKQPIEMAATVGPPPQTASPPAEVR